MQKCKNNRKIYNQIYIENIRRKTFFSTSYILHEYKKNFNLI